MAKKKKKDPVTISLLDGVTIPPLEDIDRPQDFFQSAQVQKLQRVSEDEVNRLILGK